MYNFENKWFDKLALELYKFNAKTPLRSLRNACDLESIKKDLKKRIDTSKYSFISIDETNPNDHKIFIFSCYAVKGDKCYITLMFKSVDYPLNKYVFQQNFLMWDKLRKMNYKKLYSNNGRAVDEDKYLNFLRRYYNIEINEKFRKPTEFVFNLENMLTR